jgi:hypothetical protein
MPTSFKSQPQWIEEFRLEALQRSLHVSQRAKRMRMLFVVIVVAVFAARLAFLKAEADVLSIPAVSRAGTGRGCR